MSPVPYLVALAPAILLMGLLSARLVFRRSSPLQVHDLPIMRERPPTRRSSAPPGSTDIVDIEAELGAIMGYLEPVARANQTKLRYAVRQVGMAQVDSAALHDVLETVVATAIRNCFGGQILLTARPLGRWIEIAVTDDGPVRDDATRHVQLDEARMEAASRGWLFSVNARHDLGTTVSIRLPAAETVLQAEPMRPAIRQDSRAGELVAAQD